MEGKGTSQKTYTHNPSHRPQCGDGQREWGRGWVKVGKMQTSVIESTIKIMLKFFLKNN